MKKAAQYQVVKKYPIFDAYIKHFGEISIDNDIPAMLSFFFLQGQLTVPYVRIPWGASHLDPRVHCFWIQSSRTGKSIAWEFVGSIAKDANIPTTLYTTGTDAGLIGSFHIEKDENGNEEYIQQEGLLNGRKGLNFDEGSILLNPNRHSQETVLYLQSACNPVGSTNNVLVMHQKGGTLETESMVSLWITTYPPNKVKDYVLTRGIFQRVLLYWSHWSNERRENVSQTRAKSAFKKKPKHKVSYADVVKYFTDLEKRLKNKVLEVTETTLLEWEEMPRPEQEELLQDSMTEIFNADEHTFYAALSAAIEDYYELMEGLGPGLGEVVASFIPAMENYTVIFATHIAMLEGVWTVTGEHVDIAKEILFDLFRNLIQWLEGEVEIGPKVAERATQRNKWIVSFKACESFEIKNKGDGWRSKAEMLRVYEAQTGITRQTAYSHYDKWAAKMFDKTKDGTKVYIRLKEEVKNGD
ncbi:MAG: hypothetical protein ACTSWQ_02990 [Candidatus Thorarchaeota archaeon]